jgi:hypothetical protein
MARIHRSLQEKRELVAELKASGLTKTEWCKAKGICASSVRRWILRLESADGVEAGTGTSAGGKTGTEAAGAIQWVACGRLNADPIEVRRGHYTISLPPGFSDSAFKRICVTLEELC